MLASVIHGCMAVASGMCRHVLVYRALNEATAWRQSTERVATDADGVTGIMQWILPFGAFSGSELDGRCTRGATCTSTARPASRSPRSA